MLMDVIRFYKTLILAILYFVCTFKTSHPSMAVSTSQPSHISPLDLIFSCTVCQDTLSSVYAVLDHVDGLRRGNDSSTSIIPRLWLTECAHVTCGKHFEGGGEWPSESFATHY